MNLLINGNSKIINSIEEYKSFYAQYENEKYLEINISTENNKSIIALLNENYLIAVFLRFDGDSGFYTINEENNSEELISFKLSNGQIDEYPLNYLIDRKKIDDIINYFIIKEDMTDTIKWQPS